jgi:hypothetical protein
MTGEQESAQCELVEVNSEKEISSQYGTTKYWRIKSNYKEK